MLNLNKRYTPEGERIYIQRKRKERERGQVQVRQGETPLRRDETSYNYNEKHRQSGQKMNKLSS